MGSLPGTKRWITRPSHPAEMDETTSQLRRVLPGDFAPRPAMERWRRGLRDRFEAELCRPEAST